MLDIVFGKKTNPQAVNQLVEKLGSQDWVGTLYVGYPIFAGDDVASVTDALLTCKEHGVVIFDLGSSMISEDEPGAMSAHIKLRQRELKRLLNARLVNHESLIDPDTLALAFPIVVLSFVPDSVGDSSSGQIVTPGTVLQRICSLPALADGFVKPLNAAIQQTAALKPKKRRLNVRKSDSMGAAIKFIEGQIANLDKWQKNAAIESPDGPQRIRGLAGSGKTIILALKAAYLHANDPDADIVITFNTRSLYQQFKNLIRRFYFEQTKDDPDWSKLQILHAWGSATGAGLYSTITAAAGIAPLSFATAKLKFGYADAFKGACAEALAAISKMTVAAPSLFDYVLIDEAQDFPPAFFQLLYACTRSPKRIVWAYDELQTLNNSNMPNLAEMFGVDGQGAPLVEIANYEGVAKEDILLPVCYRNPSWLLSTALGIGLGTKREGGLPVQMFSSLEFWSEIGYDSSGDLSLGKPARLIRNPERSAQFFSDVLKPSESIQCKAFETSALQAQWVARDIHRVLQVEELDPTDILIVIPNSLDAPAIGLGIAHELKLLHQESHIVGVTGSRDLVFVDGSIAMCGIYRAKGNEAPLVYVVNAEYGFSGSALSQRRNMLFTALTRAKAWVRITGVGERMTALCKEIEGIAADNFELRFKYPTAQELLLIRSAYGEQTKNQRKKLRSEVNETQKLLQRIAAGEVDLNELPPDLVKLIRQISKS